MTVLAGPRLGGGAVGHAQVCCHTDTNTLGQHTGTTHWDLEPEKHSHIWLPTPWWRLSCQPLGWLYSWKVCELLQCLFMVISGWFVMDSVYMFMADCNNVITAELPHSPLHSNRKLALMGEITKIDSDSIQSLYLLPREVEKLSKISGKFLWQTYYLVLG